MIYKFVVTVYIVVIKATYKYYVQLNCDAFKIYERMKKLIVACVRKL